MPSLAYMRHLVDAYVLLQYDSLEAICARVLDSLDVWVLGALKPRVS